MFTDVVGYTALTEQDEPKAIEIRDRHRDLVLPLVAQFQGQLIDATGDETLAVFPSSLLAVDCALAIQASLRDDPDLKLRIGIHLGDILMRDAEVAGEGVNIASRIRPLADPGGICVSASVWELVRNRSYLSARPLGSQPLKNVSEPVEVFALGTAPPTASEAGQSVGCCSGQLYRTCCPGLWRVRHEPGSDPVVSHAYATEVRGESDRATD